MTSSMPQTSTAASLQPRETRRGKLISIVIPMLNEEHGLIELQGRLVAVLDRLGHPWEVVMVDDGSKDGTLAKLREINAADSRFKAVSLSRNFGKEIALAAGLRYAAGDAAILMDADLQHPPELLEKFLQCWYEGYDVVYGQRVDRHTDGPVRRAMTEAFYTIFRYMSGTHLPEGSGDFRLLDRKAIAAMNRIGERARFNKGLFAWIGFRSIGIPFHVQARPDGVSRWRPRQLLRFALDGITSFTTMPLRIWSYLGVLISMIAFGYSLVFLVKTLLFGTDVPGFPTLVISVLFLGGVQLISLGVIGEYMGRMFEEVKGRPLFLVAEEVGIDRTHADGRRPGDANAPIRRGD